VRGFKEDFDSWRSSLTPEEQKLVQTQAEGEFNKKFRKSDEFKKDLPEEKMKSFSKILGKFFDAEAADYKKEISAKVPNYGRLLEKAGEKVLDFSMTSSVVEIDRDAERRYNFASQMALQKERAGEPVLPNSMAKVAMKIKNDDEESHKQLKELFPGGSLSEAAAAAGVKVDAAKLKAYAAENKLPEGWDKLPEAPAMGEDLILQFPRQLGDRLMATRTFLKPVMDKWNEDNPAKKISEEDLQELWYDVADGIIKEYYDTVGEVEALVQGSKAFYRSQAKELGKHKTKADVLRSIHAELGKVMGTAEADMQPLDEELLAELEEEPALQKGEFDFSWGTADKLYKSEAIDAFGIKYLLGVFETQEEAIKAFEDWNAEYVKARADMTSEMQQWSKQENARLEEDTSGADRIRKILEEARR
jgi:hypothetical protein